MTIQERTIRVVIVDDHPLIRLGLKYALLAFDDVTLVGEADSGEAALRLCDQLHPDVVLMDVVLPGVDGVAATRAIRERYPQVRVVALTSFQNREMVQRMLQAGAAGYLLKNMALDELVAALRMAAAGQPALSPEVIRMLVKSPYEPFRLGQDLTARQQEVLALLVTGLSNKEIAGRLIITPATARHHVSEILSKLGARSRAEAAVLAVQHDLVGAGSLSSPVH
jgi:NarL family two-component system response regulator LiaR